MANSHLVGQKKTTKKQNRPKNNRIVGQMWLGILSELPLFYQTCPSGLSDVIGKDCMPVCYRHYYLYN